MRQATGGSTSATFEVLSHTFSIRCDDPDMQRYVSAILGKFAVGTRATDPTDRYEILDLGPDARPGRYRLLLDGSWILGSDEPSHVLDLLSGYDMRVLGRLPGRLGMRLDVLHDRQRLRAAVRRRRCGPRVGRRERCEVRALVRVGSATGRRRRAPSRGPGQRRS